MTTHSIFASIGPARRYVLVLRWLFLVLILSAAAALRFTHINWDQFQHVHPDERFIVWVADSMSPPRSLAQALDPAASTINPFRWPPDPNASSDSQAGKPRAYAYGHFPLYLLVAVAHAGQALGEWFGETTLAFPAFFQPLHTVGRRLTDYNYLTLVGRALSALADLGTLLLVYWLAKQSAYRISRIADRRGQKAEDRGQRAEGQWPMADNRWRMAEGRGRMAEGRWQRADGRWQMADGRWQRAEGRGPMADDDKRYAISDMRYAISDKQSPIPNPHAAALLAAAAYAFAVLPIQLSHFAAVDALLTFCVTATVALAGRWATAAADGRRLWLTWLAAGAMAGLAVGSKFSAVLLIAPLLVAACYGLPTGDWAQRAVVVLGRLAVAVGAAVAVFAVTNPFAFIEFLAYGANVVAQQAMVSGLMDAPYTRQYVGTAPYLYFVQQLSQWGLGWPLGIAAWGGLAWAFVRLMRRRAAPLEAVMLAWAVPYFVLTGGFHAKFLRYMAPLIPFLLVFAAGAALALRRWLGERWRGRGQVAWWAAIGLIGAFTVAWAVAFTGVYRQEHPWIQASRWIYTHIPADSKLLSEHWDDALPLTLDEVPGRPERRSYRRADLPLYDPDTEAKLDRLVAELSSADYIILASDRLAAPIQRLPRRYPMASQYYRMLFNGDLGYVLVAEFTAYPRLGTIVIPDDHADESFRVYDHPRTRIFANTGRLSASLLRARLGRYLPLGMRASETTPVLASPSTGRPPGLARYSPRQQPRDLNQTLRGVLAQAPAPSAPFTLPQPVDTLPVVADFRWNRFASEWQPLAVVLWYLVLGVLGWAAWPLLFPLLSGLRDRGYGLMRTAGWLLVGWVHWIGVSAGLWQNRVGPLAAITAGLIVAGLLAWRAQRREMATFWAERRGLLLAEEGIFLLAYLAFVGIRLLNPDLWQPWNGGEKFMEFAFLNAVLRSPHFPPYDPYFAGGILNYYYYGFYLISLPIKLTGIFPEVAFNLAVPALFALAAVGVYSVAYTLANAHAAAGTTADEDGTRMNADERGEQSALVCARPRPILRADVHAGRVATADENPHVPGTLEDAWHVGGAIFRTDATCGADRTRADENLRSDGFSRLTHPGATACPGGQARKVATTKGAIFRAGQSQGMSGAESRADRPGRAALLAVVFALLMGNQAGLGELLRGLIALGGKTMEYAELPLAYADALVRGVIQAVRGASLPGYDYWAASRVIPFTINEFPFWTFLFADLHPHMIAVPFGLLVVGLALNWVLGAGGWKLEAGNWKLEAGDWKLGAGSWKLEARSWKLEAGGWKVEAGSWKQPASLFPCFLVYLSTCLLLALALGSLGATNTWDLPTYFLLVAGALLVAAWRQRRVKAGLLALMTTVGVGVLSVAAYLPFYIYYRAQFGSASGPLLARYLGWVREASPLLPWLVVWAFFLFLAYSYAVAAWRRGMQENAGNAPQKSNELPGASVATADEQGNETGGLSQSLPLTAEPAEASNAEHADGHAGRVAAADESTHVPGTSEMPGTSEAAAETQGPNASEGSWEEGPPEEETWADDEPAGPSWQGRGRLLAALGLVGVAAVMAALDRPTAALALVPLALMLAYAFRRDVTAGDAFLALLLTLGLGILVGTELVYLRDFLQGSDWQRMNTLFKFGVPAWILLGIAAGVIWPRIWTAARHLPAWLRLPWQITACALLISGLTFLPLGTRARVEDRFPGPRPARDTLDGMAFMTVGRYTWPDANHPIELAYDYRAIQWLLDNVLGTPVLAEAPAGSYSVNGQVMGYDYYRAGGLRAASLTGLPTFVGHHQSEQRPWDQVGPRTEAGQEFFQTTDLARTRELLAELRVGYIYIGQLERTLFAAESLAKFDALVEMGDLEVVYRNPQVIIYRVKADRR